MNRAALGILAAAAFVGSEPSLASGAELAQAAEVQVGVTLAYDPAYVRLAYPGGDVRADRGVCSDVVVRVFRGIGVDLQVEHRRVLSSASTSTCQARLDKPTKALTDAAVILDSRSATPNPDSA